MIFERPPCWMIIRISFSSVIVALPQPKYDNEAAYIGFTTKIILLNSKKPKILEQSRYFAYELAIAPGQVEGQEPRFAFCEWGKNNVHSNMGFLKMHLERHLLPIF